MKLSEHPWTHLESPWIIPGSFKFLHKFAMFDIERYFSDLQSDRNPKWRPDSDPARRACYGKNSQTQNLCVGFYKIKIL